MKEHDFKLSITGSGKRHYLHIENGEKRDQILQSVLTGKITKEEFAAEQKKMRGGYLKYIYNEAQYSKAIQDPSNSPT